MSPTNLPENYVLRFWQKQVLRQRKTVAINGQPLEVLYSGRPNDCRGGDFCDAVILFGKDVRQGSIEIHSRTSDWQGHGHHLDHQYNKVILHVAWQQDSNGITFLENGQSVPTIVLDRDLNSMEQDDIDIRPCCEIQTSKLGSCLERLGEVRLADKVSRFCSDIKELEAEQAFYAGILEGLGFSKNKRPFLELAQQIPLRNLSLLTTGSGAEFNVEAYLLGSAGLLPSQRGMDNINEDYVQELEQEWEAYGLAQTISCGKWDFFKVRPSNHPVRRIIALSKLLSRFRIYGWLDTWQRELVSLIARHSKLNMGGLLMVKADGYWTNHYDFSFLPTDCGGWLLGQGRADEIFINVVIPFFIAWSGLQGEYPLANGLEKIYRQYNPGETNAIQRHMIKQLKTERGLINSALRQQGLLHLYKAYCTKGRCVECLLVG